MDEIHKGNHTKEKNKIKEMREDLLHASDSLLDKRK